MWDSLWSGHEWELLAKLGLSLLVGVLIGLERETRGKPAGIGTHCLVIGGAMLFTTVSHFADPNSPARVVAQVVTGIGFLGAGIIFHREGGIVSNLTTAAEIWYSAALGVTIGLGLYVLAVLATLYAVIVTRLPKLRKKPGAKKGARAEAHPANAESDD